LGQEHGLQQFIDVLVVDVGLLAFVGDDEGDPSLRKDVRVKASLHGEAHTEQAEPT
jgi:hypothetical protein